MFYSNWQPFATLRLSAIRAPPPPKKKKKPFGTARPRLAQSTIQANLQQTQLNYDLQFIMPLESNGDFRDTRPLNLIGRLGMPHAAPKDWAWKNCHLVKRQRTEVASQMKPKDMVVEELELESLPATSSSSDYFTHHHGPRTKSRLYEQIGSEALAKFMDATIDQVAAANVVFVDTNPLTGECLEAFLLKRSTLTPTTWCKYFAICSDESQLEWLKAHMVENLSGLMNTGSWKIPGVELPAENPPADLMEAAPARPQMQALAYDGKVVVVPTSVVQKFAMNEVRDYDHWFEPNSLLLSPFVTHGVANRVFQTRSNRMKCIPGREEEV